MFNYCGKRGTIKLSKQNKQSVANSVYSREAFEPYINEDTKISLF
jgi:hypothetical protein